MNRLASWNQNQIPLKYGFNEIFDKYRISNPLDKGYDSLLKGEITKDADEVFGKDFNKDIFNAHFDKIKTKKKTNTDMIEYKEPEALNSSMALTTFILGMDEEIEDFGTVNGGGLCYTDLKKAHVDETLLINPDTVKYKKYDSVDQLKAEREKIEKIVLNLLARQKGKK